MTEQEILNAADVRFHMDAEFHARVEATALILSSRHAQLTGARALTRLTSTSLAMPPQWRSSWPSCTLRTAVRYGSDHAPVRQV